MIRTDYNEEEQQELDLEQEFQLKDYLFNILARITPTFLEKKLTIGHADNIEEEIEDLYREKFELEIYVKDLLRTNSILMTNYEDKNRELYDKISKKTEIVQCLRQENELLKREIQEIEVFKNRTENWIGSLNEQIGKMEIKLNNSTQIFDNLNEEILTLSDYEDKLYTLEEEIALNSDLINNLKRENFTNKKILLDLKEKKKKKERDRNDIKYKLPKFETKLRNLQDNEKREKITVTQMQKQLEFFLKNKENVLKETKRKENDRNKLIKRNNNLSIHESYEDKKEQEENEFQEKNSFSENTKKNNLKKELYELNLADEILSPDFKNRKSATLLNSIKTPVRKIVKINEKKKKRKRYKKDDIFYKTTLRFLIENRVKFLAFFIIIPILKYKYM